MHKDGCCLGSGELSSHNPKYPPIRSTSGFSCISELEKKLKKAGCRLARHGTNHDEWYSPMTGKKFQVPRHQSQEVKTGIANAILKQAGLK